MNAEPHDEQDIANLLSDLGRQTPDYPPELLEKRRAVFLQGLAGLSIGAAGGGAAGGGAAGGGAAGGGAAGSGAAGASAAGAGLAFETVVKALIAVVLFVEIVGGTVYFGSRILNRRLSGPGVVTLTPSLSPSVSPSVSPVLSPSPSATETPTPGLSATAGALPDSTAGSSATDTPSPTATPRNRGKHLGHTPTPPGQQDESPQGGATPTPMRTPKKP